VNVAGLSSTQEVGTGTFPPQSQQTFGTSHALLWGGTPNSAVDLNPEGFLESYAVATDGTNQVGTGYSDQASGSEALLWSGTAASAVVLSADYQNTFAVGVRGNEQVGYGFNGSGSFAEQKHAMLWAGTAASGVDLSPSLPFDFYDTYAFGTNGIQQVGYGNDSADDLQFHALLWNGTAASAIDLNPTDIPGLLINSVSAAIATNGVEQVGYYAETGDTLPKAIAWFGTANSAVDLNALLPSDGTWVDSEAFDVDSNGNMYGTALGTVDGVYAYYAIEWIAVPEPNGVVLAILIIAMVFTRHSASKTTSIPHPVPSTSPAH
jgi:hypothetical protein